MTGIVHVVDDDEGVCGSLHALLELKGYAVRSHATSASFLDEFKPGETLCILADLRMPGMGGLELQEHLIQQGVDVPFIMITGRGDVNSAVRALKSGAADFIEKPLETPLVLAAVERAAGTRQKMLTEAQNVAEAKHKLSELTPRESEVLHFIISGKPNKVIAFELGISQRTVENHRARLMMKTHASNVAELIKIAMAGGLTVDARIDMDQSVTE
jgi:two-component system, LuxR family, response regulator FixJ